METRFWKEDRPRVLVVACSDGRLQEALDDFLHESLGIFEYDRLYLPGGPGALACSGYEYARSDRHRQEFRFLLEAHMIEEVLLIFHGPSMDGPEGAACADYRRSMGNVSISRIREEQAKDAREVLRTAFGFLSPVTKIFYCEVQRDASIKFYEWDVAVETRDHENIG